MNPFNILPDDVLWQILSPTLSNSIKNYVVWYNHYLYSFGLTAKSNNKRMNAYLESEAFKTALHPCILNLGQTNSSLTWNNRIKKKFQIASEWLFKPLELTQKKEILKGNPYQVARINPDTQQWELIGPNFQRDAIYHICEGGKEIGINLKTKLDDYDEDTWRRPYFEIALSQHHVAVVNGSFSVVVYDCKNSQQYPLNLQEIILQVEIRDLKLYVRTIAQDESSQHLFVYELEKIENGNQEPQIHLLPADVNRFHFYKEGLVLITTNFEYLRCLPLANLKNFGIENEWNSFPLSSNNKQMGICFSEIGIFTALTEGDKLKIQYIQMDDQGYNSQEKTIPLDMEFHKNGIFDMVYYLDRLIIRAAGFKILVVDYFSERVIQTFMFKDLAKPTIVLREYSHFHQMLASTAKIHLFFLHKERVSDDSIQYFTHVHRVAPKA